MLFRNGTIFYKDDFKKSDIRAENGVITEIAESIPPNGNEEICDCKNRLVLPGLVEIHSHGCAGYDFSDAPLDGIYKMTEFYAEHGITSVLATTMTMPRENYRKAMQVINSAVSEKQSAGKKGADIIGINMEGPFLGINKKGAHDERYLEAPDTDYFEELDRLSGNNIKLVSIDPEYKEAEEFIKKFSESKVISLAHTSCGYERAVWAFENGAGNITHLFNAMNPLLHREPGIIGAFADCPEKNVTAEMICDGIHIHSSVIRMMFRLCGDNIILISDSMRAAGLSDGEYELGGIPVYVKNGKALQKDGTIAGSAANLFDCMVNAVKFGVPPQKAIKSAASIPAKLACPEKKIGKLEKGFDADIILLDKDYKLLEVYLKGKKFVI